MKYNLTILLFLTNCFYLNAQTEDITEKTKAATTSILNANLKTELKAIKITNQQYRAEMVTASKAYGWKSPQIDKLETLQKNTDAKNTKRIIEIITEYGYPGKSLVGAEQASTAFLIIQHADLEVQEKYLPIITKAADAGELPWKSVALLVDRVRTSKGQKQIYGSQLKMDDKSRRFYFLPIENPHKIDSIRAAVGLGAIQRYAAGFNIRWNADKHILFHQNNVEKK